MSPRIYSIHIDESSQTDNRFLALGAVVVPLERITEFHDALLVARLPELPHSELKWQKVSRAKIEAYCRYIRVFFDFPSVHFHAIVVDTSRQRHGVFNEGDRETGFNKEIYQLVLKCGRLYRSAHFHVYPDERSARQTAAELRTIINRGLHKKYGTTLDWPVRRLHYTKSHSSPALQLADIFSGAIAYHLNGHFSASGASEARRRLSSEILTMAKVRDPRRDTAVSGKFTIWHRQLRVP